MQTKTTVAAAHGTERKPNGADGCHGRWVDGFCPGVETAKWLNDLGWDDEPFGHLKDTTNLDVRLNWLRSDSHIVALEPELAQVMERIRELQRDLAVLTRRYLQLVAQKRLIR